MRDYTVGDAETPGAPMRASMDETPERLVLDMTQEQLAGSAAATLQKSVLGAPEMMLNLVSIEFLQLVPAVVAKRVLVGPRCMVESATADTDARIVILKLQGRPRRTSYRWHT